MSSASRVTSNCGREKKGLKFAVVGGRIGSTRLRAQGSPVDLNQVAPFSGAEYEAARVNAWPRGRPCSARRVALPALPRRLDEPVRIRRPVRRGGNRRAGDAPGGRFLRRSPRCVIGERWRWTCVGREHRRAACGRGCRGCSGGSAGAGRRSYVGPRVFRELGDVVVIEGRHGIECERRGYGKQASGSQTDGLEQCQCHGVLLEIEWGGPARRSLCARHGQPHDRVITNL
jgi:hypothetical protein